MSISSAAEEGWQARSLSEEFEHCPGCDCVAPAAISVFTTLVVAALLIAFVGYFRKPASAWRCLHRIVIRRASSLSGSVDRPRSASRSPTERLMRSRGNSKADVLEVTLTEEQAAQLEALAIDARADLLPLYKWFGTRLLRDCGECLLYSSDLRYRIGKGGEGDVFRSMLLQLPSGGPTVGEIETSWAYKLVAYKV